MIEGAFLEGDALDAALEEVSCAAPSVEWWDDWTKERYAEMLGGYMGDVGWTTVEETLGSWPRLQARFARLLQEACAASQAVVVLPALLDDQGPIGGPADEPIEWLCAPSANGE